jgi:CBS domain containing-hemolysin-like protein
MDILLGLIALALQGLFAGTETSFTRANWIRLSTWSRAKRFGADRALRLVKNKEKVIVTTLVGTNLFVVLASVLFSNYFITNFGNRYAGLAAIIVVILSLIFSEFLPKTVAHAFPERWAILTAYPLSWAMRIFSPATYLLSSFARGITSPLTKNSDYRVSLSRKDFVLALREYDLIHKESWNGPGHLPGMAARLFEFSRMKVGEVALPLSRVASVPEGTSLTNLREEITKCGFSRYPVYRGNPENITGVIHTKDLLFLPYQRIRRAYFVSKNARAMEVLSEMRHRGEHLAIVKDEQDKTYGIITLEDLIEELVGEIRSED